jgi:hypothetical protein
MNALGNLAFFAGFSSLTSRLKAFDRKVRKPKKQGRKEKQTRKSRK